jgi:hypothetical protein
MQQKQPKSSLTISYHHKYFIIFQSNAHWYLFIAMFKRSIDDHFELLLYSYDGYQTNIDEIYMEIDQQRILAIDRISMFFRSHATSNFTCLPGITLTTPFRQ